MAVNLATASSGRSPLAPPLRMADYFNDPIEQILAHTPSGEPTFVEPMKCKLVDSIPSEGDWLYELDFEGYRALGIKRGSEVQVISADHGDLSAKYPELISAFRTIRVPALVLDGQIVMLDHTGRPTFGGLQNLGNNAADRKRLFFFAFDVLNYNGRELMQLPLEDRRYVLQSLARPPMANVRFVRAIRGQPEEVLARAREQGLGGIIAKECLSHYEAGRRSGSWLKCKTGV